ncbi:MAG: HD domain-containing protein, partial [Tissierellia bacterium]|nr:HD domain-containing protein [Tissierellia bacterium]
MKNIERAIDFAMLMEEMKKIERQTRLIDSKRRENDAEHSYHVAMMAWILQDYSDLEIDINKVIKMLLV